MRQGMVGTGNRSEMGAPAVAAPVRAGGDDDAVGPIAENLIGGHVADPEVALHRFLQLGELDLPVRDHAPPFVQTGQGRHGLPMAAQLLVRFAKVNHVAALAQNARALHARGAAAYHQHGTGLRGFREFLGMPAAAVFLADGDVLSAHDLAALLELGDTDVAADALADIPDPAFRSFGRLEGMCDRSTVASMDVQQAVMCRYDHVVANGGP